MSRARTWRDYTAVKKYGIIEDYVERFSLTSFNNELPALLSFFYVNGQAVVDEIRVPIWASILDPRVHVFWIQPTRTGKTIAWEFISEVLEGAGIDTEGYASTTDAGLIGTIYEEKEGNETVTYTKVGALGGKKALNFDEGSVLLQGDRKTHSNETILYLQQAMNPIGSKSNILTKPMAKGTVTTQSSVSLWITTYPPQGVKDIVLTKGLFQRVLLFVVHWDDDDRKEVSQRRMSGVFKNVMHTAVSTEDLSAHFIQVRENCKARLLELAEIDEETWENYTDKERFDAAELVRYEMFSIDAEWDSTLLGCIEEFYGLLTGLDPQMKEIVASFMPNIENHLILFATHLALTEGTWVVRGEHLEMALEIIYDIYERLILWLETDVEVGQQRRVKLAKIGAWKGAYSKCETNDLGKHGDGWVQKSVLFTRYMKQQEKSKPATYNHYKDAKQWFEERKGGSIVYVRWKGEE